MVCGFLIWQKNKKIFCLVLIYTTKFSKSSWIFHELLLKISIKIDVYSTQVSLLCIHFKRGIILSFFSEEILFMLKNFIFLVYHCNYFDIYLFLNRFVVCLTIECQIFDLLNHLPQNFMFISGSYVGLVPYYTALEIIKKKSSTNFFFGTEKRNGSAKILEKEIEGTLIFCKAFEVVFLQTMQFSKYDDIFFAPFSSIIWHTVSPPNMHIKTCEMILYILYYVRCKSDSNYLLFPSACGSL